jgi:hypothetical protein
MTPVRGTNLKPGMVDCSVPFNFFLLFKAGFIKMAAES